MTKTVEEILSERVVEVTAYEVPDLTTRDTFNGTIHGPLFRTKGNAIRFLVQRDTWSFYQSPWIPLILLWVIIMMAIGPWY